MGEERKENGDCVQRKEGEDGGHLNQNGNCVHEKRNGDGTREDDGDFASEKCEIRDVESTCGLGPCQPWALQCCKNVLSFSLFYGLSTLATSTLSVYIVSQVTALEKQFNLNSTTTGIIFSCNDIGFLVTVLFVSHFGKTRHIPRILSIASVLFGISGIVASLCYFLDPVYLPKISDDPMKNSTSENTFVAPLCIPGNDSIADKCNGSGDSQESSVAWPIWLLGISLVLQGIGKSPRGSLSATYIDDNNLVKTKTGFYLGIGVTMNLFGPALAIALGGVFRSIPVDLQDTLLTPTHPKWIGAWWLGFLVFGMLGVFVAIPLLFFPKHILPPKDKEQCEEKESKIENVKDLPRSIIRVFKQPIYTLPLIGLLFLLFVVGGTQSFNSKYVEKQFMVPGYKTNIMLGIQTLLSASIGTFTGGVLTSRLKLTRLGCLRMVLFCLFIGLICSAIDFFLGCETPYINGYYDHQGVIQFDNGLTMCACDTTDYFPVCGEDGVTYFSPCFAGCTNQSLSTYGGCSKVTGGQTVAGMCETDCPYLYYFLAVDVVQKLIGTMAILPLYMTLIRSVEERDKTIALALFSFLASLLGFLPAPIFFGYVIDSACLIWDYSCGKKGSCAQYDLRNLRYRLKSIECGGKVMALIFFLLAFIVLKLQGGDKADNTEVDIKVEKAKKTETSYL